MLCNAIFLGIRKFFPICEQFIIHVHIPAEQPNQCTVHFINDGITVSGNTATAQFTSTGPAQAFVCSIDRGTLLPCKNIYSTYA